MIVPNFDWPAWTGTDAAKALVFDESCLAAASIEDLRQLLTVIVRQERFVDGALLEHFQSGLIVRILRRAATILRGDGEAP